MAFILSSRVPRALRLALCGLAVNAEAAAEQRNELAPFHRPGASRASNRKNSMPPVPQQTAAVQDFNPAFVRFGSFATKAIEALRPWMSASLRKRTSRLASR
jgi:hypothetical protein